METSTSRDLGMLLECMTCVNCMNSVNDLLGVTLLKPEDEENVRQTLKKGQKCQNSQKCFKHVKIPE